MTELNKEFVKETGFDVFKKIEDRYTVYTAEYVKWLEAKNNNTRCCTSEAEQLACKKCNKSYEQGWAEGANHVYTECMPKR